MESFCVKQNNSPAASLSFDMSYVGSRVVGSYLFTTVTSFILDTLLGIRRIELAAMESFCVKQNNSPAASLSFDLSHVGSKVMGSYLLH